jgi:hypothetical protein
MQAYSLVSMHTPMHICLHPCMHAYIHACMFTHMHAAHTDAFNQYRMYASIHPCMHTYLHASMLTHINAYIHKCIHACKLTYMHTQVPSCMYTCNHTCIPACIYVQHLNGCMRHTFACIRTIMHASSHECIHIQYNHAYSSASMYTKHIFTLTHMHAYLRSFMPTCTLPIEKCNIFTYKKRAYMSANILWGTLHHYKKKKPSMHERPSSSRTCQITAIRQLTP